jgi:hypothetical protein
MRYEQEESIYNLVPRKNREQDRPEKYVSNFKSDARNQAKSKKESHKTMGLSNEHADVDPTNFTKKGKFTEQLESLGKGDFKYPDERRPAVPKAKDAAPLMGIKTTKNFITTNAVENIMAVPKKPATNFADTRNGDTFPLEESGLVPKYRTKKQFGETPEYIKRRTEEMKRAQEEYDLYVNEHMRRGAMKQLSQAEHDDILNGLKRNWDETMLQYQSLPVVCDNLYRKHTKEKVEAQLKNIERDIELFEKHCHIYVA